MSFIEGEITVEFGGTVGPAGPAGNAVPIAAGTVLANPSGVLANPVGVDAAGMREIIGLDGAFLDYLQSLPSTIPATPNIPWWDNNVLKRSSISTTFRFFRPNESDSYIRPFSGTYLRP